MSYQFLTGGYATYPILQSTLPIASAGEEQKIVFSKPLPDQLSAQIQKGDVIAIIGCKDQRGELIKIKQGTYSSNTRGVIIIRGVSRWANGAIEPTTINFTQPNQLLVDFSIINPALLQSIIDRVGILEGQDDLAYNSKLPVGTTDKKGTYKSAYRASNLASSEAQFVITNDMPAHQELYKAVFGATSNAYLNGIPTTLELSRIGIIRDLVDYLSFDPNRLTVLKKLIEKEINIAV